MRAVTYGLFLSVFAVMAYVLSPTNVEAISATSLKCEYQVNPVGIDTTSPRFSWILESSLRNEGQTAYQILVASTPEKLLRNQPDLWDSGKVLSGESLNIVYSGQALLTYRHAYWKVRVWDQETHVSKYSDVGEFEMALLNATDWRASWISRKPSSPISGEEMFNDHPAPLLRKEFVLEKKVTRARAYVSGLGYYELRLNGKKVGDHVLDPGWTSYAKRVLYSTYDITKILQRGHNAVGVMLGNGWFNPLPLRMWGKVNPRDALIVGEPRAMVQLVIEFADGTSEIVVTDDRWKAGDGPILRNSVYLGEVYDARREQPGWDDPGFDDIHWEQAIVAAEPKVGPLHAQDAPPIRITRTLKPVKLSEPKPGVFIFDFGQNFSGWSRLHVKGPVGTRVRLRSGELLYADGTLNGMTAVCGQIKGGGKDYIYDGAGKPKTAFQLDEYILKGEGTETYTPRFTFHGFRYVEVTGFPGKPTLDSLEGLRLNSDVGSVGSFECSNQMFNRIQQMVLWTELANIFSVQSDCPHREKFGYGGDIVASSETGMLNFDMSRFYAKAAQDLADAVRPNGGFTETSPFIGISDEGLGDRSGPIGWGTAQPLLLWQLRQYYGDRKPLEKQYELTKKWVALLHAKAKDGVLDNGISDHESLVPKPRALTGTAFYFFNVKLLAQLARAWGKDSDAAEAEARAEEIKTAFNKKFLQAGIGKYDFGSQACQTFALYHGLVPDNERTNALNVLLQDIAGHDGHLTTGIFGTKYMLHALSDAGRANIAYAMVNQRSFPGWGHMLENGATTLWEHWEFNDNTYSHNHPMFGSVSEWFYKWLAGIQPAPDAVGFNKIIIKPQPVGDLKWVNASYNSVRGKIVSEWKKSDGEFNLHITIPVGANAVVFVPAKAQSDVKEGGKPIGKMKNVRFLKLENNSAVFAVGSGDYRFSSR
jgi:alpha-L-rhamnosidase